MTVASKPKPRRKSREKTAGPSLAERLIDAMRGIAANAGGEDNDVLRYTLPPNATLAQVRTARRAAEKKLRARQAARRARMTVCPFAPADVTAARQSLRVSSECLADFLNVPHSLVEAWEEGTRSPKGAALRLLADIRARPDYWRAQLSAADGVP